MYIHETYKIRIWDIHVFIIKHGCGYKSNLNYLTTNFLTNFEDNFAYGTKQLKLNTFTLQLWLHWADYLCYQVIITIQKCDNKIHDFGNEYLHIHTQTSTVAYNYICDLIFQSTYNYTHNEPVHVCKLWLVEICLKCFTFKNDKTRLNIMVYHY